MNIFLMILFTFLFIALVIAIMSVGVLFKRKPIAGSCGGLSALGLKEQCEICGGDDKKCEKKTQQSNQTDASHLAYDATEQSKN